jgi:hypothetical protein
MEFPSRHMELLCSHDTVRRISLVKQGQSEQGRILLHAHRNSLIPKLFNDCISSAA